MGIAEVEGSELDRKICLASIDQNVLRNTSRETPSLSIKRGEKWVRLQRDKLEDGGQKKLENNENKSMTPNKRSLPSKTRPGATVNEGSEKHVKLQNDQENMYNVQVGVANHNWSQVIK